MGPWTIHDPVLVFALMVLLVLAVPMISARLRIPGIVGLFLAGIVTGPSVLGLFPENGVFDLLRHIGLLYLMFLAGLEMEFHELVRHRAPSLLFGALTFLIPQVAGAVGARWLLGFSWPKAILLASMFASHTLISFPIVTRFGLSRHRVVPTALGGTILTNTAALLVLAVIVEMTRAQLTAWFWFELIALLALFLLWCLSALPRLGFWFFRVAPLEEGADFLFALAAAFTTAYLGRWCRVEPIIGAFFAGLSLNRLIPKGTPLMSRLTFVGEILFIPFFLISVGMLVDVRVVLQQPQGWAIAGYMLAAALLTKWWAAQAAGLLLRYAPAERRLLFGLSVNQAAASLAAVIVGQRLGIFDDTILNGSVLMILVTCMVGVSATQSAGHILMQSQPSAPAIRTRERRIVVALANPKNAEGLVDLALVLREKPTTPVHLVSIVQDGIGAESRLWAAEQTLAGAVARAVSARAVVYPSAHLDTTVAGGVARAVREARADILIMGWSRRYEDPTTILHWLPQDVMERTQALTVLAHLRHPLTAVRRVWWILPAPVVGAPGFEEVRRTVAQVAGQRELHVLYDGDEDERARLQKEGLAKRVAGTAWHATGHWTAAVSTLQRLGPGPQDLVILTLGRPSYPGWHPRMGGMAADLQDRCPETDFMVIHLPGSPEDELEADRGPAEWITADRIAILEDPESTEPVLAELVVRALGWPAEQAREAVRAWHQREPLRLRPHVELIHGEDPRFPEELAFLVVIHRPSAADGSQSLRLRFYVFRPPGLPPEQHLRILMLLARACRTGLLENLVLGGADAETLAQALRGVA